MHKYLLIVLLFTGWQYGISQQAGNDIDFLVKTIKSGYAGYRDKVNTKEFDQLVDEIKRSPSRDSFALLSRVTTYFNDLHLILYDYHLKSRLDSGQCRVDYDKIMKYLDDPAAKKDAHEGYWMSEFGNCIIGLRKTSNQPLTYKGFVVETAVKAPPGFCILSMEKDTGDIYRTDYREEGLAYRVFLRSKFREPNILLVNSYGKWRKIPSYTPGMLKGCTPFSYAPGLRVLDSSTVLIKMPDFGSYNIRKTDSIIQANAAAIGRSKHLIVDIRNNMGGSINNYLPLLPLICDKDIVQASGLELCSEELAGSIKEDIAWYYNKKDTARAHRRELSLQRVTANKNRFFMSRGDTIRCQGDKPSIRHVSVIINNMCLSAAELMLLDFKQSGRVKLFGEVTGGAVDYLDALNMTMPSGKYVLLMAVTKRVAAGGDAGIQLDKTGIQPDVSIPENTPDWVAFVKGYYEKE